MSIIFFVCSVCLVTKWLRRSPCNRYAPIAQTSLCYIYSYKIKENSTSKSVFTLDYFSLVSLFSYFQRSDCLTVIEMTISRFSRSRCIKTCALLPTSRLPSPLERFCITVYVLCCNGAFLFTLYHRAIGFVYLEQDQIYLHHLIV